MQVRTGQGEGMARGAIARIFHRHAVTGLHQQLCTKADGLLRATGDHYLLSAALHAPRTAQVRRDQATQATVSGRVAIAQLLQVRLAPESPVELGPYLKREQIERRHADTKRLRRASRRWRQMVVFQTIQSRLVDNFGERINR